MNGQCPFIFVSNWDNCLKLALKNVFPEHIEIGSAKHIEANVTQRFGKECGRHVMAMAKTYSVRYFNEVLDLIQTSKSTAASKYIEGIGGHGVLWSNPQWTDLELPPRFGIATSNTSESVNSMFNSARDLSEQVLTARRCQNCATHSRDSEEALGGHSIHVGHGIGRGE
jgi:hypothetical protein